MRRYACLCTLALWLVAGAAKADDSELTLSKNSLVRVQLSATPIGRVSVSFDDITGRHQEVDFDPSLDDPLVKTLSLSSATWMVSVAHAVVTLRDASSGQGPLLVTASYTALSKDPIVFKGDLLVFQEDSFSDGGTIATQFNVDTIDAGTNNGAPVVTVQAIGELPSMANASKSLSSVAGGALAGRSFDDVASQALTDLFVALAEAAKDRAKSRGFALIQSRIVDLVCSDLKIEDKSKLGDLPPSIANALEGSDLTQQDGLLFPATCVAVRQLRLEDLASAGETLANALFSDIAQLATRVVEKQLTSMPTPVKAVLESAVELALDSMHSERAPTSRQAQLLITHLAAKIDDMKPGGTANWQSCGLQLMLAAVAVCTSNGSTCDARLISDVLTKPENYFVVPATCTSVKDDIEKNWPDLDRFVTRAHNLFQPLPQTSARDQQLMAIALAFDIADRFAFDTTAGSPKLRTDLRDLRTASEAIVRRDAGGALVAATSILDRSLFPTTDDFSSGNKAKYGRASKILGAVTAYLKTYDVKGRTSDPDVKKQEMDARKEAISSLIDAASDRRQRDHDFVISLGANVGLELSSARFSDPVPMPGPIVGGTSVSKSGISGPPIALTLPTGLAFQWLPAGAPWPCNWGIGGQLTLLDLAQYLTVTPDGQVPAPKVQNALAFGGQIGVLFGPPEDAFSLMFDFRYVPALVLSQTVDYNDGTISKSVITQSGWRFGIAVSYYVSFFDLR